MTSLAEDDEEVMDFNPHWGDEMEDHEKQIEREKSKSSPSRDGNRAGGIAKKEDGLHSEDEDDSEIDDDEDRDDDDDDDNGLDGEDDDLSEVGSENEEEFYQREELPAWACRFCEVSNPKCVVQCKTTGKWFCNSRGRQNTASCIVHHLVRSKNKQVALHPESPLGESTIECFNCENKNVFMLGFVPAASDDVVVLLCRACMIAQKKELKDNDWQLDSWTSLIKDKSFLPWLVPSASEKEQLRCRPCTTAQMDKLELLWQNGEDNATMDDIDRPGGLEEDQLEETLMEYNDGYHYQNVFGPLIKSEADYDKEMKARQGTQSATVRFETDTLSGKPAAYFYVNRRGIYEESGFGLSAHNLLQGDEMRIRLSEMLFRGGWEGRGNIRHIAMDGEICLELKFAGPILDDDMTGEDENRSDNMTEGAGAANTEAGRGATVQHSSSHQKKAKSKKKNSRRGETKQQKRKEKSMQKYFSPKSMIIPPPDLTEGYQVEVVWKSVSFDRMQAALRTFAVDDTSLSGYLYHRILGKTGPEIDQLGLNQPTSTPIPDDKDWSVKGLPKLNASQNRACTKVISQKLSLIQGPPGTGKTVTSSSIVYHLVQESRREKKSKRKKRQGQVLVCAPSNIAVDQLAGKISITGLKVVRLVAKSRESVESAINHLCLHVIVKQIAQHTKLGKLMRLREETGELRSKDQGLYQMLLRRTEREILESADVICTTCVGAGDPRISRFVFRKVLVDEATQATEPEVLIPICRGAKQVVLVGDHCQLGPVVACRRAASAGLTLSLFERFVQLNIRPVRLEEQYRMHPCLSAFPSNTFYEGALRNGISATDRIDEKLGDDFFWPEPETPMVFLSCTGPEELSASGTSYLNRQEAMTCEKVVTTLLKQGCDPLDIGVITPYEGQRSYITQYMERNGPLANSKYQATETNSVDAFQGREKRYIILSCVRSNEKQGIGFLRDRRRLNVALTRAKYGLIILGNPVVLARSANVWYQLIKEYQDQGLLMSGPLERATVYIKPPKDWKRAKAEYRRYIENHESRKNNHKNDEHRRSSSGSKQNGNDQGGYFPYSHRRGSDWNHTDDLYSDTMSEYSMSRYSQRYESDIDDTSSEYTDLGDLEEDDGRVQQVQQDDRTNEGGVGPSSSQHFVNAFGQTHG
eukprot:g3694.t1